MNGRGEAAGGPGHCGLEAAAVLQHHLDLGREFALGLVDRMAVDARIERADLGAHRGLVGEVGERAIAGEERRRRAPYSRLNLACSASSGIGVHQIVEMGDRRADMDRLHLVRR